MHPRLFFSVFLFWAFSAVAQENNYGFAVRTHIENGTIEGNYDTRTGIRKYFGIPFAKPPVGELRWKAPQPPDNWKGVKQTKKFGPRPMQWIVYGDMVFRSEGLSEDCLYLNVWSPAKRDTRGLPVLVYFYGGGFVAGDASEPRYDGESMARKGIVVVTVNYRLNLFGFLSLPELSAEAPYKSSGNYGLLDQVAALQWVQRNIAAFGGNPGHVTIAGESAGSISVSELMASPLSKNLFQAAIGESGAAINPTLPPVPLAEAEKTGSDFLKKAGIASLTELRKLTTQALYEIYKESKRFGFPAVIDHYFLPAGLPEIFEDKKQAMVPLLAGWNSAEIPGTSFMQGKAYTEENFVSRVKEAYPKDYEEILKLWPHANEKEVEQSATGMAADGFIVFGTWKWLDLQIQNSGQPVYRYLFSRVRPPRAGESGMPVPTGARHATEIEYCMGNLPLSKEYAWTANDYKVSRTMQDYFAHFIISYNPNGTGLPEWPAVKPGDKNPDVMNIDVESKVVKADDDPQFRLFQKIFLK
jgi:para-nitrobenzyl esterase